MNKPAASASTADDGKFDAHTRALEEIKRTFVVRRVSEDEHEPPEIVHRESNEKLPVLPADGVVTQEWKERVLIPRLPEWMRRALESRPARTGGGATADSIERTRAEHQGVKLAISRWCMEAFGRAQLSAAVERTKKQESEKKPVLQGPADVAYDVYSVRSQDGRCKDIDAFIKQSAIGSAADMPDLSFESRFTDPPLQPLPASAPAAPEAPREAYHPPDIDTQLEAAAAAAAATAATAGFGPPYTLDIISTQDALALQDVEPPPPPVSASPDAPPPDSSKTEQPPQQQPVQDTKTTTTAVAAKTKTEMQQQTAEKRNGVDDDEDDFVDPSEAISNLMARAQDLDADEDILDSKEVTAGGGATDDDELQAPPPPQEASPPTAAAAAKKQRYRRKHELELAQRDAGISMEEEIAFLTTFSKMERERTGRIQDPVERQRALSKEAKQMRRTKLCDAAKQDYVLNDLRKQVLMEGKKAGILDFQELQDSDDEDDDFAPPADDAESSVAEESDSQVSSNSSSDSDSSSEEETEKKKSKSKDKNKSKSKSATAKRKKIDDTMRHIVPKSDEVRAAATKKRSGGGGAKATTDGGGGKRRQKDEAAAPKKKKKATAAVAATDEDLADYHGAIEAAVLVAEHLALRAPESTLSRVARPGVQSADLRSDADRKAREVYWRYAFAKQDCPTTSHLLFRYCAAYLNRLHHSGRASNQVLLHVFDQLYARDTKTFNVRSNPHAAQSRCAFTLQMPADKLVSFNQLSVLPVATGVADLLAAFHFGTHFDVYIQQALDSTARDHGLLEKQALVDEFKHSGAPAALGRRWVEAKKLFSMLMQ